VPAQLKKSRGAVGQEKHAVDRQNQRVTPAMRA
jgi:hypothetical protein